MRKIEDKNEFFSCSSCNFTEMRISSAGNQHTSQECPECGEAGTFRLVGVKRICPTCSEEVKLLMTRDSNHTEIHGCKKCQEFFTIDAEEEIV
jgi:predicted RNA-binding Zn-ribbon protein involved in translation (DUF1610 family)